MADPAPYRKLPGPAGSGVISFVTLWQGDTHLLQVTSWPSGEGYRRFFFRDIQAIVIRRTRSRLWINLVLGFFALLAVAGIAAEVASAKGVNTGALTDGFPIFCEILLGICLFFLVLNTLLGPTCAMHIQTAIQFEKLPTVRREGRAHKILAKLQPLVEAAQGDTETETSFAADPAIQ